MFATSDAASLRSLMLGEPSRVDIDLTRMQQGLNSIEVVCAGPSYVTLHVEFSDVDQASIEVQLDALDANRYGKALSLIGAPRRSWLEILPGSDKPLVTLNVRRLGWGDKASFAWRAALRHASAPRVLAAKARQALSGGSSLVFTTDGGRDDAEWDYAAWQAAFENERQCGRLLKLSAERVGDRRSRALVVVPPWKHGDAALEEAAQSLLASRAADIHVLSYAITDKRHWASAASFTDVTPQQPPSASIAQAVAARAPDLVLFLDRPGQFSPVAIACLSLALAHDSKLAAAYGDHDVLDANGTRRTPSFKPCWSPDYQLACGYVASPVAFRADPASFKHLDDNDVLNDASGALLTALACRHLASDHVASVPLILFHERCSGTDATKRASIVRGALAANMASATVAPASGSVLRVRHSIESHRLVSVIVPTKENPDLLARAWRSVRDAKGVTAEVIVVDNGASSDDQRALLADIKAAPRGRIVEDYNAFNFSRLINAGRAAATGDVIVLMNDDVEATEDDWLRELAAQALRSTVGCVGALLTYPDGRVQHAGVLLGINGGAGHAFRFGDPSRPDFPAHLLAVREVAAVTAACLAVRAHVFDEVGGFSEDLPVTLNDVDFCLKVASRGYRNIVTPFARLIHRESTSRGLDTTPTKLARLSRESARFQRRWGKTGTLDPWSSPHLSRAHEDMRPRRL